MFQPQSNHKVFKTYRAVPFTCF